MGKKKSLESLEAERKRLAELIKHFATAQPPTVSPSPVAVSPSPSDNGLLKAVNTALENNTVLLRKTSRT